MRLSLNLRAALSAALLALLVPISQAQAQDCVKFQDLNHCGIGAAKVSATEKGVRIDVPQATGKDGVAIHLPSAAAWTAEIVSDGAQRNLFTAVAEGEPVSTTTVDSQADRTTYSATFTGSGENTTYSVIAYYNGRLQAAVGGVRSGEQGAVGMMIPGGNWTPSCRPRTQTYDACLSSCYANGYSNCNYCSTPCRPYVGFGNAAANSACFWTLAVAEPAVRLPNGQIVRADRIVLHEEVSGPSNYPYLSFNRIDLQTTARSTVITAESVTPAGK
ncbi:hypothetical protein [Pyxidicoccus trucidator]|uniref:hypothetical protein n=1 Tax=Pyxidicoccus trucidator TaxID=2709662 RepID=UPI0013D98CC7|nr:hypothetical protein [Pyxidicoccus trucidator]